MPSRMVNRLSCLLLLQLAPRASAIQPLAQKNDALGMDIEGPDSKGETMESPQKCTSIDSCTVEFKPYRDLSHGKGGAAFRAKANPPIVQSPPTPWMAHMQSRHCAIARGQDLRSGHFIYCATTKDVVYSPTFKLAYIKTGKAASTAFFSYFMSSFSDATVVDTNVKDWQAKLPEDTFFFTFVREPISKQLASYAEIDAVHLKSELFTTFKDSTFTKVPREKSGGADRYLHFLDDLVIGRFGITEEDLMERSSPRHASSQLSTTCTHGLHFVGHLENIQADWDAVQDMAGLPMENRSFAIPKVHAGEREDYQYYAEDEGVNQTEDVLLRMCRVYRSDFDCLGYDMPLVCQKRLRDGLPLDSTVDNTMNTSNAPLEPFAD